MYYFETIFVGWIVATLECVNVLLVYFDVFAWVLRKNVEECYTIWLAR